MKHAEYQFREEFQPIDSEVFYDDGRPQDWKEILYQDQLSNFFVDTQESSRPRKVRS